jgi:hypothetical protein
LEGGDEYETKIKESIGDTKLFILICSGSLKSKDMSWCYYEAAQFRAKLTDQGDQRPKERLICFYDNETPQMLARYQAVKISAAENNNVAKALIRIVQSLAPDKVAAFHAEDAQKALLSENVEKVVSAFSKNYLGRVVDERVLLPRLSFVLPAINEGDGASGLSDDTVLKSDHSCLRDIFGIAGATATWRNAKAVFMKEGTLGPRWIKELESAVKCISMDRIPDPIEGLVYAGGNGAPHRAVISRYEVLGDGRRECYVNFIQARKKQFDVAHGTSVLLIGLIYSIRFRERVLPLYQQLENLQGDQLVAKLKELDRELNLIESESGEYGLNDKDNLAEPPIVTVIGGDERRRFVLEEIEKWKKFRLDLMGRMAELYEEGDEDAFGSAREIAQQVAKELLRLKPINTKFIQFILSELAEKEGVELKGSAEGPDCLN